MNLVKRESMPLTIARSRYPATLKGEDYAMAGAGCASWRGGGFRDECKDFFAPGVKYRVPGFLATSLRKYTAENFISMAADRNIEFPRILWCIKVRACVGLYA